MEKFAFVFPGQGTQFVQMGQYFYNNYLVSRQTFDEASEVLGFSMDKLCFEGRLSELNDFINMQLAIVTTEVAIYKAYIQEIGIVPQFLVGHSIGQYSALVCCGAIRFADALRILVKRGELVKHIIEQETGRMTIVENCNEELIQSIITGLDLTERVFISCYNSNNQIAVSGYNDDMDCVEEKLVQVGATISPLFMSPPMHSPLMEEVKDEFRDFLSKVEYHPFNYPIISNVTGKPFSDSKKLPEMLSEHLVRPVRWSQAITKMYQYGVTAAIEMSPKILLGVLIKEIEPQIKNYCYCIKKDRLSIQELVKADANSKKDIPNIIGRCLGILVSTPNRNENQNDFNKVKENYHTLCTLYDRQKENNSSITSDDEEKAIHMLIDSLKLKKIDLVEIKDWIYSLLEETGNTYRFQGVMQVI